MSIDLKEKSSCSCDCSKRISDLEEQVAALKKVVQNLDDKYHNSINDYK